MSLEHKIEDVLDTIRDSQSRKGCALLLGAGCSVSAGIPTAAGFVKIIKETFRGRYEDASEKSYSHCMKQLSSAQRRNIVRDFIEGAKINWGHISVAQLIANKYVSRVLTTNFDPLVSRACAMINEFPAIYDFGAKQDYDPDYVPEKAIFHLHGQHTGFRLMNTDDETMEQFHHIRDVIRDCCKDRPLIVVGYSGECDPVFKYLAEIKEFNYPVYWVCYKDESPSQYVIENLLIEGKYASLIFGYDADDFFVRLAQCLDCFPPSFVARPFSHMNSCLDLLTPYRLPGSSAETDATQEARDVISNAIVSFEYEVEGANAQDGMQTSDDSAKLALLARSWLMAGEFDNVIAAVPTIHEISEELREPVSEAYHSKGMQLTALGMRNREEPGADFLRKACAQFEISLQVKPGNFSALNNWGVALMNLGVREPSGHATELLENACDKFEQSLRLKPDLHYALNNWGIALVNLGNRNTVNQSNALLGLAREKFELAIKRKPDYAEAMNSLGYTLTEIGKGLRTEDERRLMFQACDRFAQALALDPEHDAALLNWGAALIYWGVSIADLDIRELILDAAKEKLEKAESLRSGCGAYNLACIAALQGDHAACNSWLQVCLQHENLPPTEQIKQDATLISVREEPWFQSFIDNLSQ